MAYVSIRDNRIVGASKDFFKSSEAETIALNCDELIIPNLVGKRIASKRLNDKMKIAIICNYGDSCGIATYSKFLIDSMKEINQIELMIFSEYNDKVPRTSDNIQCWKRGESLVDAIVKVLDWNPNFIIIQHEFGIFPKATHFLKMLEMISDIPYAVVLHSTYEHLDKTICTSAIKNIIVHTEDAKKILRSLGNTSNIYVIPHGCVVFEDVSELWNIFQTPYSIIQFGFGFSYKGVEIAIDAVSHLKKTDPKFKEIYYCYLCSENERCKNIHADYYSKITKKINELDLNDNVGIIKGFHEDKIINNFLRTAKIAIFPYLNNPGNVVYGASGAIRIAMANNIPVIASKSHLFDDMENVLPRISNHMELAKEIDEIFSNDSYRNGILYRSKEFINVNKWDNVAKIYISTLLEIEKSLDLVRI